MEWGHAVFAARLPPTTDSPTLGRFHNFILIFTLFLSLSLSLSLSQYIYIYIFSLYISIYLSLCLSVSLFLLLLPLFKLINPAEIYVMPSSNHYCR